jgi:hypothetical protein
MPEARPDTARSGLELVLVVLPMLVSALDEKSEDKLELAVELAMELVVLIF